MLALFFLLCLADAEIRNGDRDSRLNPLQLPPQSSNGNYKGWASRNETCVSSDQLRTWCAQNKNHRYIPEWLLKTWQMHVDPDLS
jgi:hypothetical protein